MCKIECVLCHVKAVNPDLLVGKRWEEALGRVAVTCALPGGRVQVGARV